MRTLVIVDRDRPELFETLATRFARESTVRVMFDRRTRIAPLCGDERRQDDGSNAALWVEGYLVVRHD